MFHTRIGSGARGIQQLQQQLAWQRQLHNLQMQTMQQQLQAEQVRYADMMEEYEALLAVAKKQRQQLEGLVVRRIERTGASFICITSAFIHRTGQRQGPLDIARGMLEFAAHQPCCEQFSDEDTSSVRRRVCTKL
jgi:hypothetical protein